MSSTQKNMSASTAIYLASHSADFTILNASGQSPLDLCSDPSLIKLLKKAQQTQQEGTSPPHTHTHHYTDHSSSSIRW